jgi:hypothetical protein
MTKKYRVDFVHELNAPLEYASGGQMQQAKCVVVPCPCNAQHADVAVLEQEYNKALFNGGMRVKDLLGKIPPASGQTAPANPDAQISDEAAEQQIMMLTANGFDLALGYEKLGKLFTAEKNAVTLDGKEKMTETLFTEMSLPDTRILLGKYLLNFLKFSRKN